MAQYQAAFAHGLMFHRLHRQGETPDGQGSISDSAFEAMLLSIGSKRILTPEEWMYRAKEGSLSKSDLCLTFDDGLKTQFDIALPVLERLSLKAFWFIYSAPLHGHLDRNEIANLLATRYFSSFDEYAKSFEAVISVPSRAFETSQWQRYEEQVSKRFPFYSSTDVRYRYIRNHLLSRSEFDAAVDQMLQSVGLDLTEAASRLWMTVDNIRALHSSGHSIGMHSYSHPFALSALDIDHQRTEYQNNFDDLSRITRQSPRSMSHPLNSYSPATLEILTSMGIECGFCSNMQPPGNCATVNPSPLEFAREDSAALLKMLAEKN